MVSFTSLIGYRGYATESQVVNNLILAMGNSTYTHSTKEAIIFKPRTRSGFPFDSGPNLLRTEEAALNPRPALFPNVARIVDLGSMPPSMHARDSSCTSQATIVNVQLKACS